MADSTKKQTFERHPDAAGKVERWEFLERSYAGGAEYKEGAYLVQHERESNAGFKRRVEQAMFVNLCAPVVDLYNGYLYQPEHKRSFNKLGKNKLFMNFLENVDFDNHDYDSYIEQLSLRASVFGFVGVVIDKPSEATAATLQQQIDQDLRPYLIYYEPEAIFDWTRTVIAGRRVLTRLVLLEESGKKGVTRYKVWTRTDWKVYEQKDREEAKATGEEGKNPLGEIPFVIMPNNSPLGEAPSSDLKDISDVNREIYYIDSLGHEIMEGTAFPMLEMYTSPNPLGKDQGDVETGVGSLLERDPNDTVGARWVEPPHTSLPHMLAWREKYIENIREIAKTNSQQSTGQAQSGEALKVRLRALTTILTNKATAREQAEMNICRLWALWEGIKSDVEIRYERKFNVDDLAAEIDMAIAARSAVPSKTFANLQGMQIVEKVIEDLSEEDREKIKQELKTPPSSFGSE